MERFIVSLKTIIHISRNINYYTGKTQQIMMTKQLCLHNLPQKITVDCLKRNTIFNNITGSIEAIEQFVEDKMKYNEEYLDL